jgi:uncharacterized protein
MRRRKRISLSIKALFEAGPRGVKPAALVVTKGQGRPVVKAPVAAKVPAAVSFDDKLAMLSSKWKGR